MKSTFLYRMQFSLLLAWWHCLSSLVGPIQTPNEVKQLQRIWTLNTKIIKISVRDPSAFVAAGWKRCLAQSSSHCLACGCRAWPEGSQSSFWGTDCLSDYLKPLWKPGLQCLTKADVLPISVCPVFPITREGWPCCFSKGISVPGTLVCREFLPAGHMNPGSSLTPPLTPCFAPTTPRGKHSSPQNPISMGWERLVLGCDGLKGEFTHPGDHWECQVTLPGTAEHSRGGSDSVRNYFRACTSPTLNNI